jgi:hypothetical protein
MTEPFTISAVLGFFAKGALMDLGRRANRAAFNAFSGDKPPSAATSRPTVIVESPKSDPRLVAVQDAYYSSMVRLKSDELESRKRSESLRIKIDAAIAAEDQKNKREELKLREREVTLKEQESIIREQIAKLEHEDRQDLLNLKKQELQNVLFWQNTQQEMAAIERDFRAEQNHLNWNVLRDLNEKDTEVKIVEIQTQWDAKGRNWPSRFSRLDTENLLSPLRMREEDSIPLLILTAPPNSSEVFSSSFRKKLSKGLGFECKKALSDLRVDYFSDFFNYDIDIGDGDIRLVKSTIQSRPTIVLWSDIDEDSLCLRLQITVWGWPEITEPDFQPLELELSESLENHEKDIFQLSLDSKSTREQIVSIYKLTSIFLTDLYYLNYELDYSPRLLSLSANSLFEERIIDSYSEWITKLYDLNQARLKYQDGLNFYKLGYYEQAIISFKDVLDVWPDFPEVNTQISIQKQLIADWKTIQNRRGKGQIQAAPIF